MNIFTRFRDIVSANINAMLDKAEDPEKMLKLMVMEMEDTLVDLKASCAATMASQAKARRELSDTQERAERWAQRAELAISKENEELAREALHEKRAATTQGEELERELQGFTELVEKYRSDIHQLEEKIQEVRQKHRLLVERHRQAARGADARRKAQNSAIDDTLVKFAQFERKIDRLEAQRELTRPPAKPNLEESFQRLERDKEIDAELEELRKKTQSSSSS